RTKDQHRVFLLSRSWIKRSSKVRLEKLRTKRACMRNGGSFPIALLMIVTWWKRGRMQARQRQIWKNVGDCVPITRSFTIGCARKQSRKNLRATSTRTKRSIWPCWHKTASAPRLLLLSLPHPSPECDHRNRLCRNNAKKTGSSAS